MDSARVSLAIFRREIKSYFEQPVAYVFMVVFLALIGVLTFSASNFYENGNADLARGFFVWHPWVFLLLVPAATMGAWAEEHRTGTIELLFTMPITMTQAIVGKFLAAWSFIIIGILLTFPIVLTTAFMLQGDLDMGAAFCGYAGSILLAGACVAIGMLMSSLTHSQVVGFVLSLIVCFIMLVAGVPLVTNFFVRWAPAWLVEAITSASLLSHFESMQRGVLDMADISYYAGVIVLMLFATHVVLQNRKTA